MKRFPILLLIVLASGCAAAPTPAPTADAPATETRIAGSIFATQTASAPTPDPRVTETAIAAKIFATQTASAPTPYPTIVCVSLSPTELPGFSEDVRELETRTDEMRAPDSWRVLLETAGVKSACVRSYIGTPDQGPNVYSSLEEMLESRSRVMTLVLVFETAEGAHTFFEKADFTAIVASPQEESFQRMGEESKYFSSIPQTGRIAYYGLFRKKNVVAVISIEGPVKSTLEGELIRIAKIVETKIP